MLNIPLPTPLAAQQLCRVLAVDRELKPRESFVSYRIDSANTPAVLDIRIQCRTVRQLRLAANALLDNVSLVVATMDAFTPEKPSGTNVRQVDGIPEQEFELSGTGRAG